MKANLRFLAVLTFLAVAGLSPLLAQKANTDNKDEKSPAVKELMRRLETYLALRTSIEKKLSKLDGEQTPEKIKASQNALAKLMQAARAKAKEGDILFPEVRAEFKKILNTEFRGAGSATAKTTVKEDGPLPFKCKVNDKYPDNQPVSTVPPAVLMKLPKLPDNLEYRFVGSSLILRDAKSNLIVDCAPDMIAS